MKDNDVDSTDSGALNPFNVLLYKLTGVGYQRPRLRSPVNVWRRTHRAEIEEEAQALALKDTRSQRQKLANLREKVAKSKFDMLGEVEKTYYRELAKKEHEETIKKWENDLKSPPSTAPEDRQKAIRGITNFMQPILDGLCAATGWTASLAIGGPEPANGGRLKLVSVNSGAIPGNPKMNFTRSEAPAYHQHFAPMFGEFLGKCYTVDECRSRALNPLEGFEPIENILQDSEDAEGIDLGLPKSRGSSSDPEASAPSQQSADTVMPPPGPIPTTIPRPVSDQHVSNTAESPSFQVPLPHTVTSTTFPTSAPVASADSHPSASRNNSDVHNPPPNHLASGELTPAATPPTQTQNYSGNAPHHPSSHLSSSSTLSTPGLSFVLPPRSPTPPPAPASLLHPSSHITNSPFLPIHDSMTTNTNAATAAHIPADALGKKRQLDNGHTGEEAAVANNGSKRARKAIQPSVRPLRPLAISQATGTSVAPTSATILQLHNSKTATGKCTAATSKAIHPSTRMLRPLATISSGTSAGLQPPKFVRPPLSSIKLRGWALDQGKVQAQGLAGRLRSFDSYVNGSIWVEGGSIEYSLMHESAPYWFNSMVALAFQLGDEKLIGEVRSFLDWTLEHQGSDGWLGPEPFDANATVPRLVWPRYLVLLGLIQYAEADPSQAPRIIDSMHKFATLCNTLWKTNQQGDRSMGFQFDYQYLVYVLQWLYDNAPQGKEAQLLETMQLVRNQGFSWKNDWYTDANFPKTVPQVLSMQTHGVNQGEALKSEAVAWRFTNDPTDIQSTATRIDLLYTYHGQASGTFAADEHLAGLNPSRGTELCAVVEQIFSLATIYSILGNNSIADRAERIAYNALPAAILPDWSGKYPMLFKPTVTVVDVFIQQPTNTTNKVSSLCSFPSFCYVELELSVNQIWAQSMDPFPWGSNGPNSNVFGFEPNYPCCTVNHPSAYPKFWLHSFMIDKSDNSLIHALLGPAEFSGEVGPGNHVTVTADTLYPFGLTIKYTINASKAFNFNIRIPDWAKNNTKFSVNGGKDVAVSPDANSFQKISTKAGTSTVLISFSAPLTIEKRFNDAVAISRGPLLYALELSYNDTTAPGLRHILPLSAQALNDVRNLYPNAPAAFLTPTDDHTKDHTLLPTTEWRVAIDPSTIQILDTSLKTSEMPFYAWAPNAQPVSMSVTACQIAWDLENGTASAPPQSPNQCVGKLFKAKLVPFGAAKLRLGEIPTMNANSHSF
ncbi:hypothetical protein CVT24_006599 [Panaeolus cyanescens]|uniref:Non-reducing end beta-L-arabinofuranosidase-like GH127 middle domain-containing protein n=1 Tax=Panaeolus cyanescens TaxID=181874 RepID=A0A409WCF5_9AGAR|nr:hypothetical protein CVT24_006599 [Panaeolus cyanescens]